MLPNDYKKVILWTTVVIVVMIAIGLLFDPGTPP